MEIPEDEKESEIHHLQFVDQEGNVPLSISFLIRFHRDSSHPEDPLTNHDILTIHEALQAYNGSITPLLTKKSR